MVIYRFMPVGNSRQVSIRVVASRFLRVWVLAVVLLGGQSPLGRGAAQAAQAEMVIGTAQHAGVYYPLGNAMCDLLSGPQKYFGINCSAVGTKGAVDNIERLRSGEINFAIVQEDILYYAVHGYGPFKGQGAFPSLRQVVALHAETFTVLSRADANVSTFDDLRGKRLNIGNPGSGYRAFLELLLRVKGWTLDDFAAALEYPPGEMGAALCSGELDAIVYMSGHPNDVIKNAAEACPTRMVKVFGPDVQGLIEAYPFFIEAHVPSKIYPGAPTRTRSFGARAVLVTTSAVPEKVVHAVTVTLFNNLSVLKAAHPALFSLSRGAMAQGGSAPLHEGALRFFRESTDFATPVDSQGDTED